MSKFTSRVRPRSLLDRVVDTLGFGDEDPTDGQLDEWLEATLKREFKLDTIKRDEDGDIPVESGSAVVFIRAFDDDPPHIEVFAPLLGEFRMRPEVYEAVNAINLALPVAKVTVDENQIVMSADLFIIDELSPGQLITTIELVAERADHYDTLLQKRFGGRIMADDDDDDEIDV